MLTTRRKKGLLAKDRKCPSPSSGASSLVTELSRPMDNFVIGVFSGNSSVVREAFEPFAQEFQGEILAPSSRQTEDEAALRKHMERGQIDLVWKPTLMYRSSTKPHARTIFDAVVPNYARMPVLNHFPRNSSLCTKAGLHRSLSMYYSQRRTDVDEVLPGTFVITSFASSSWPSLKRAVLSTKPGSAWICKPSALNCGRGIQVFTSLDDITAYIDKAGDSVIVQKYIANPLLWPNGKRKFDIRMWGLVLDSEKIFVASEGYLRTCSEPFSMDTLHDATAHLTNYCLQRKGVGLGQFEDGNTLSFADLQTMLDESQEYQGVDVSRDLVPRFQTLILDAIRATMKEMNMSTPGIRKFELFGFDILLDDELKPWLIEANTNPFLGVQNTWHRTLLDRMTKDLVSILGREYFGEENLRELSLFERIDQRPVHAPRGRGRVYEKWLRVRPKNAFPRANSSIEGGSSTKQLAVESRFKLARRPSTGILGSGSSRSESFSSEDSSPAHEDNDCEGKTDVDCESKVRITPESKEMEAKEQDCF